MKPYTTDSGGQSACTISRLVIRANFAKEQVAQRAKAGRRTIQMKVSQAKLGVQL